LPKLIYSMSLSLYGFIEGPDGNFDRSVSDEELHRLGSRGDEDLQLARGLPARRASLNAVRRPDDLFNGKSGPIR